MLAMVLAFFDIISIPIALMDISCSLLHSLVIVSHCCGIFRMILQHIYKIEVTRKCEKKKFEMRLYFIVIARSIIMCIMCTILTTNMKCCIGGGGGGGCIVIWAFLPRFSNDIDNNNHKHLNRLMLKFVFFLFSHLSIVWN